MKSSKLTEIFKNGNIVIPMYLLKNYKNMNLGLDEFVYLMYLYHHGDNFVFDPATFSNDLNISLSDVMVLSDNLTNKGFINVSVVENDKGYVEDIITLEGFYNKIKSFLVDDSANDSEGSTANESTVYEVIEKEFGRTISPFEYEIINAWIQNGYSDEIIIEAVKEAVFNGVSTLKYIDKILYEWNKKGIKTIEDVEKNRQKRSNEVESNKEKDTNIDLDIVDWDWFEDE